MAIYFVLVAGVGELAPVILIHTSIAAAIYGVGVASALVLHPRRSVGWWMGVLSCVLVLGLRVLAGAKLFYPAVMALAAVLVGVIVRGRRGRERAAADDAAGVDSAGDEVAREAI
jgi:amino acid efflux transporter